MKIAYFTSAFPYKNPLTGKTIKSYIGGGVENVVYNLAVQMAKRDHDVFIFTSSIDSKNSIEDYGKIKIYRYKQVFKIGEAPISLNLMYDPLLSDINIDIIHSHIGNLPAPLTALFYAKTRKKALITTYHEDWMGGFGSVIRRFSVFLFDSFIADKLLSESNLILTPSEHYIDKSKHLCKVKNRVRAVPNGINLEELNVNLSKEDCREKLNLPLDKKIILFTGGLTPRKAPDILLKAMSIVIQKVPDAYLVFVGKGMMKEDLEKLTDYLSLNERVRFTGFVSDELKLLYYKASDLFILPSFSEGFGIVLLEASVFELPLIVSDLEVFNSIVKSEYNGLFTKRGDERDLAEKMVCLLQNEDLRVDMGKNAKENLSKFTWDRVADETEKIYLNCLS